MGKEPNKKLIRQRELKGWSQEKLAEVVGTTAKIVGRWERGESKPTPLYRMRLIKIFHMDAEKLGLIEEEPFLPAASATIEALPASKNALSSQPAGSMRDAEVVDAAYFEIKDTGEDVITRNNPGLELALKSDTLSHLSKLFDSPFDIGEQEVSYFEQQTRLFWRVREESILSSNRLYTHVIRHIEDMTTFLTHSLSPAVRLHICSIVCRTVLLAGILLYDMGYYEQARKHYLVASQAATEANNPILQALVWGWMSFTWTYTKQYSEALVSVQQARHFAAQTSGIVVQAWLGAIEAEIQAHLYNRPACLQSLEQVEQAFGTFPPQDISYLFEFSPVLLLGYKGVCLQRFYQKDAPETHPLLWEARMALEQALASDTPMKRKLYYLSDLAGVYAREGDVEAACSYVTKTLPLIMQIGNSSKTIRQHLIQARTLLQPYQDTLPVRSLDEQMTPVLIL